MSKHPFSARPPRPTRRTAGVLLVLTVFALLTVGCGSSNKPSKEFLAEQAEANRADEQAEATTSTTTEPSTTTIYQEEEEPDPTMPPEPEAATMVWTQSNSSSEYPTTVEFTAEVSAPCPMTQESGTRWRVGLSCLRVSARVTDSQFGSGGPMSGGVPTPALVLVGSTDGAPGSTNCASTACAIYPLKALVPTDTSCDSSAYPATVCEGSTWTYEPLDEALLSSSSEPLISFAQYEQNQDSDGVGSVWTVQQSVPAGDGGTVGAPDAAAAVCELAGALDC